MKNLMIAFAFLLLFVGCGCEEKAVIKNEKMQNDAVKSMFYSGKETTYEPLTKCDEDCLKSGWCTITEKSKCKTSGKEIFKATAYKIKRPGGKPTVCSDISSCAPPKPDAFVIKLGSFYPNSASMEILTQKGEIFARSYVVAYEEETGSMFLKFKVENKELGGEFLLIKGETVVLNDEGEKIEIDIEGELGIFEW